MTLTESVIFEQGDRVFLVAPLRPAEPNSGSIEELAFGKEIVEDARRGAPNPNLAWFSGHYVEADLPNGNGAMWQSDDLAIASVTPTLMPVTVMHDFRSAVGLIADARLMTPAKDSVPRAKIDTTLALWRHRFPDVYEEAIDNYRRGELAQSVEAHAPHYNCSVCGMGFTKLPGGAERRNWCAHLSGESDERGARTLRDTVFTGVGLIFGTRGARPADAKASLEFQDEVAEFHQRVHRESGKPRRKRSMDTIEIKRSEYDELTKRPTQQQLDELAARAEKAEKDLEAAEAEQKKAEAARDKAEEEKASLQQKVDEAEETARQGKLRDDRLDALGVGFMAALGDKTKERLRSQAASLSDDDWTARLEELEELTGKTRDLGKPEGSPAPGAGEFSAEEIARHQGGGSGGGGNGNPTPTQRQSVLAGLIK